MGLNIYNVQCTLDIDTALGHYFFFSFMVESASKGRISKLEKLQEKALNCIENECKRESGCRLVIRKTWYTTAMFET